LISNDWYRLQITFSGSTAQIAIYIAWNNSTAGSVYIQDAQLEIGLAATEVIESGASTGKAGLLEDEPRFDYSGGATCPSLKLEPSRTQLVTQSEYFGAGWSLLSGGSFAFNQTTSPEGVQNASTLSGDGVNANAAYFSASVTSGTAYAFSIYAKQNGQSLLRMRGFSPAAGGNVIFDLSDGTINTQPSDDFSNAKIEAVGTDGWYRCSVIATADATNSGALFGFDYSDSSASGGLFYVWGAQMEAGSYPSSYIPNHSGGTITRGADDSIVESLGYSSTCTFYYEFNTTTGRETSSPFAQVGKDSSNKFYIKGSSANIPQFQVQGNGIFSGSISSTNEISGTNKIAVQWSSGVGVVFSNGVKQSGTLTNSNTSENIDFISMRGNGTSHDSKQLLFFEEALSDTECIKLTTI